MQHGVTRRRALQLGAGSAMAVYLAACGGDGGSDADDRIVFKTWEDHYLPQQLDEMRRARRHRREGLVRRRQPDELRAAEARLALRRRDRRRAVGARVPRGRPGGGVRPGGPLDLAEPLPGREERAVLDRGRPHDLLPARLGAASPLLQPGGGEDAAGLVGGASRPLVPREDRAPQGAERHHGQGRRGHRRGGALRDDRRRDRAGEGLPDRAEAEHPEARAVRDRRAARRGRRARP